MTNTIESGGLGLWLDKLNGGRGLVKVGDIVTKRNKPGNELRVERILNLSMSGDSRIHIEYKTQAGQIGSATLDDLLLTSDSELSAFGTLQGIREMVAALKAGEEKQDEDDSKGYDEAREAIEADALSVEVRSDWVAVGGKFTPGEFRIVLCFGGPNVEIIGELDEHLEPCKATLRHSWATPWENLHLTAEDEEIVLTFARVFYFGE